MNEKVGGEWLGHRRLEGAGRPGPRPSHELVRSQGAQTPPVGGLALPKECKTVLNTALGASEVMRQGHSESGEALP